MGRYDFLDDEELRKKLEEKQKEVITKRKKKEVRKKKKEGSNEEEKDSPRVYTKEDGSIGGVIYPKNKDMPRKREKSATEALLGDENNNPGEEEEELPVKLHHTKETKVGTADRPRPKKKKVTEKKSTKDKKKDEDVEDARSSIWQ